MIHNMELIEVQYFYVWDSSIRSQGLDDLMAYRQFNSTIIQPKVFAMTWVLNNLMACGQSDDIIMWAGISATAWVFHDLMACRQSLKGP